MLQQTTVATVKSYFTAFVSKWPSVNELASASESDVMAAWAGLGYYSRARNLKACADIIAGQMNGHFPQNQAELIKLPGIGAYTSAAIAAIAFNEKTAVVDGNIERVVTRFTANATPLPKAKPDCAEFMQTVTPPDRPGDFAQAMMDLGATICTPKNPACGLCPVMDGCKACKHGNMTDFPVKAAKAPKPNRKGAAFVAQRSDGAVWLRRREAKGLLGGMSEIPTTAWTAGRDGALGAQAAPWPANWTQKGAIRHTFTHFHLELEVWYATGDNRDESGWWSTPAELPNEALPTVMKKVISAAIPNAFKFRETNKQ